MTEREKMLELEIKGIIPVQIDWEDVKKGALYINMKELKLPSWLGDDPKKYLEHIEELDDIFIETANIEYYMTIIDIEPQ